MDDEQSAGVNREEGQAGLPDEGDEPQPEAAARESATPSTGEIGDPNVGRGLLDANMGPSSAMAHLYRGEVHRMKLWRDRLDRTTNWAVILMVGVLTWAFSNQTNPHYVILLGNAAMGLFLVIESRRYRAYDVWRSRVRQIQENVWSPGLDPDQEIDPEWRRDLAADYKFPALKISGEEAIAHRLRRIYLPLFAILNGAWLLRVTAFETDPWPGSAAVGPIPGIVVTGIIVVTFVATVVVAFRPRTWHARGELRSVDLRKQRKKESE